MDARRLERSLAALRRLGPSWPEPAQGPVYESREPFVVLVACLLSLRTREEVSYPAAERLLSAAPDSASLAALPEGALRRLIYPVAFYRVKSRGLRRMARQLLERHGGRVPGTMDELLALHGVGRKTANLTLLWGFGGEGLCVDTHVHRVSNRWGYVETRDADATERALRAKLPRRHWSTYNDLLVPFGRNLCTPLSPRCSRCPVRADCARRGVTVSR